MAVKRGHILVMTMSSRMKAREPKTTSSQWTRRTFGSSAARNIMAGFPSLIPLTSSRLLEGEGENQADEGERLGQGEADDHLALKEAAGLGLARDGLHAHTEDQAHADAGADGGEAVTDDVEVTRDVHYCIPLLRTRRRLLAPPD